jgi:hypothetical protein
MHESAVGFGEVCSITTKPLAFADETSSLALRFWLYPIVNMGEHLPNCVHRRDAEMPSDTNSANFHEDFSFLSLAFPLRLERGEGQGEVSRFSYEAFISAGRARCPNEPT